MTSVNNNNLRLHSYLWVRRAIGIIGIILPFAVWLGTIISAGSVFLLPSISDYYYTVMGNFFVGALCAVSLFLFTYKGYDNPVFRKVKIKDNAITNVAAVAALGVAFLPCHGSDRNTCIRLLLKPAVIPYLHYGCAAVFFIALASLSIWGFTQNSPEGDRKTERINGRKTQKGKRNSLYRICGIIIFVSIGIIGAIALYHYIEAKLGKGPAVDLMALPFSPCPASVGAVKKLPSFWDISTFFFETTSLLAFGLSWLVKGETLWKDAC